jgi:hypothetical protein
VDGLHTVGDILTKINTNCVINLHAALLFKCLFYGLFPMHDYNCLYVYGYFPYMLHVCGYCYLSMKSDVYRMYCLLCFIYKASTRVLHVYIYIYIYIYINACS